MKRFTKALKATTMAVAAGALVATSAMATDGMFGNGTGARNKALAGAGVADQNDATAMSNNPAGMVNSDTQFTGSASLFSPRRGFKTSANTGFVPPNADVESDTNYFIIPNLAYVYRIDANSAFGLSMYGNGGMNSDYNNVPNANAACGGGSGTFCAGNAGVDLTQIFLSAGYAQRIGNFSWGVAPIVGITLFEAVGLGAFAGFSSDPTKLTGNDHDISVGIGARGGVELALTPSFRIAAAGATRIYYSKLNEYGGLFENGGSFDVPANITLGVALDVMPNLTVMADYKHIFYSSVGALGNTNTTISAGSLGTNGGPGFGWNDINVYKFGVEWDVNPGLTLRAGYSYNDNPIPSEEVMFNILAPATVQHHITAGAKMKVSDSMDFEFAAMYAPEGTVSGPELAQVGGGAADDIEINMYQWEVTAGVVWHLGQPEAPLK